MSSRSGVHLEGHVQINHPNTPGSPYSGALASFPNSTNANINEYNLGYFTNEYRKKIDVNLKPRGPYGKLGRAAKVNINSHVVQGWPTKDIWQYDVSLPTL